MTISLSVFCCCFASISFFDIDSNKISEWTYNAKKAMGWDAEKPDHVEDTKLTWGAQVLLAMAMSKLFVPVKLGLAAALTPFLARRLRYFGFNLSAKGGYKEATNQVKQKLKSFKDKNIP